MYQKNMKISYKMEGIVSKLLKDTCLIQISGGYGMLSKEREPGYYTVYVYNFFDSKIY